MSELSERELLARWRDAALSDDAFALGELVEASSELLSRPLRERDRSRRGAALMNDELNARERQLVEMGSMAELVTHLCECGVAGPESIWGPRPTHHAVFCPGGQVAFWISRHVDEAVEGARSMADTAPAPHLSDED